ncbi:MAG: hypothetical protein L0338_04635 [Acidobacteria bacterium]|nr:hypothetical protein [Acidobacteriota bacterium]
MPQHGVVETEAVSHDSAVRIFSFVTLIAIQIEVLALIELWLQHHETSKIGVFPSR